MRLVLASQSPYRRKILDDLGVAYLAASPDFHEDHLAFTALDEMVVAFARGKAQSLARAFPDALIIGADQTAELSGRALTKPETEERAVEQLLALSGRTHRLLTAVALLDAQSGVLEHRLVVHHMTMRALTEEQARKYVTLDRPLDCVGAYKIEAHGAFLFSSVTGEIEGETRCDQSAIVGLPVTALEDLLRGSGRSLMDFRP
jgi:septum formation protein